MFRKKHPEVLVVGAGPVGLFTALVLVRNGVRVKIVDREWRTGAHSYALALHPRSLALFDKVGLLDPILKKAYRVRSVAMYDNAERKAEMRISDLGEDFSFVAVTRQSLVEQILEDALHDAGVRVDWNHQVSHLDQNGGAANVEIDRLAKEPGGYAYAHTEWTVDKSFEMSFPFVIGADGSRSSVRKSLGIDFPSVRETASFAVFEFATNTDLHHELSFVFDGDTTNLVWPLPDDFVRWSFELKGLEAPEESREKERLSIQLGGGNYTLLREEQLHQFLEERAPWFLGDVEEIRWRLVVRFESRLADSFGNGRVWLAGDAGHMTGPAGVQSMNVGLREGFDLANRITEILGGSAGIDSLTSYNDARLSEWRGLLGLEGALKTTEDTDPWIAGVSDRLMSCFPESGENLERLASQLGLEVTREVLVD